MLDIASSASFAFSDSGFLVAGKSLVSYCLLWGRGGKEQVLLVIDLFFALSTKGLCL